MIAYVTVGTNDMSRAATFFDALFEELGAKRLFSLEDNFIAWGTDMTSPMLAVTKPYDKQAATVGNGMMVALAAGTPEKVDAIHKKAMELGAKDEGQPGPRGDEGVFYAAYFRDLDGNKFNAFCMKQQ